MMSRIGAFFAILAAHALVVTATTTTTTSGGTTTSGALSGALASAASAVAGAAGAVSDDGLKWVKKTNKDKSCKATNEFVYPECGTGDDTICCDPKSACITAENLEGKKWKKKYYCSKNRSMNGVKLVKLVMIPAILFIAAAKFVVLMALKCDIVGNHVTKIAVAVIAVAWPLFLSQHAIVGAYCCIVACFVSFVSQSTKGEFGPLQPTPIAAPFPWWVYRLAWLMAAFQVVLLLGPVESFHVPLYKQSTGSSADMFTTAMAFTENGCSAYFGNYFTLTSIEMAAKGADPGTLYYGLCADPWLNFVQIVVLIQAFLWVATLLVSAPVLLGDSIKGQAHQE